MSIAFRTALGMLAACLLAATLWWFFWATAGRGGELDQQREWSLLQGLEFEGRVRRCEGVLVVPNAQGTEFDVAGIPQRGELGCAWIMLNPTSPPAVKAMPPGAAFQVTREDLKRIGEHPSVNPQVMKYLQEQVSP